MCSVHILEQTATFASYNIKLFFIAEMESVYCAVRTESLYKAFFLASRPLKIGPIGCPETTVRNYNYSLHNNPEHSSYLFLFLYKTYQKFG
jgi:hypothetical protein